MGADYELKDLQLREVNKEFASNFVKKYHYSKQCPTIILAIGEWIGIELKNIIVFNYCVGREMANEVWGGDNSNTIELARMVSLEPKPKNMESYCIAKALNYLKENYPQFKVIISYADNEVGHKGYCYQASGFTYYGQSRPTAKWYLDGKRVHERTLNTKYGSTSLKALKERFGDRLEYKLSTQTKSRYYIILAQDKREKREIQSKIKVQSLPYPKGDNTRYDMTKVGNFKAVTEEEAEQEDTQELRQQISLFDLNLI